jgi:hypothetical protein
MPRRTKAEYEAELANWAETLLLCSAALNDDTDWSDDEEDEEFDDTVGTDGEALELLALEQLGIMECLSGDGSRGPYDNIPKSKDFFPGLLSNPERRFRHFFRQVKITNSANS